MVYHLGLTGTERREFSQSKVKGWFDQMNKMIIIIAVQTRSHGRMTPDIFTMQCSLQLRFRIKLHFAHKRLFLDQACAPFARRRPTASAGSREQVGYLTNQRARIEICLFDNGLRAKYGVIGRFRVVVRILMGVQSPILVA